MRDRLISIGIEESMDEFHDICEVLTVSDLDAMQSKSLLSYSVRYAYRMKCIYPEIDVTTLWYDLAELYVDCVDFRKLEEQRIRLSELGIRDSFLLCKYESTGFSELLDLLERNPALVNKDAKYKWFRSRQLTSEDETLFVKSCNSIFGLELLSVENCVLCLNGSVDDCIDLTSIDSELPLEVLESLYVEVVRARDGVVELSGEILKDIMLELRDYNKAERHEIVRRLSPSLIEYVPRVKLRMGRSVNDLVEAYYRDMTGIVTFKKAEAYFLDCLREYQAEYVVHNFKILATLRCLGRKVEGTTGIGKAPKSHDELQELLFEGSKILLDFVCSTGEFEPLYRLNLLFGTKYSVLESNVRLQCKIVEYLCVHPTSVRFCKLLLDMNSLGELSITQLLELLAEVSDTQETIEMISQMGMTDAEMQNVVIELLKYKKKVKEERYGLM